MGYLTVAIIQFVLVAVLIATLPLWNKVAEKTSQKKQEQMRMVKILESQNGKQISTRLLPPGKGASLGL